MKGRVIHYSPHEGKGIISGEDGRHYAFTWENWKVTGSPRLEMKVNFEAKNNEARNVYIDVKGLSEQAPKAKSKAVAGLLALFLGFLGAHKFYLGLLGPGFIYFAVNTIGLFFTKHLGYLPNYALGIIAIVEGILYLTKTEEEFDSQYMYNKRPWF